jgi:ribonuclease J
MMVFQCEDSIMVVDAGIMFPEDYMLGIDIVVPEITYLRETPVRIDGIVLTHGHEDHIGALPYILNDIDAPIYGTAFTLALVRHKLRSHHIAKPPVLIEVTPRETRQIGRFGVEFIRVSHSVIDGVGLAIDTPVGCIVHSGDFKINQVPVQGELTDMNRFAEYGERGVLALLSDSTNVEREGYTLSEKEIGGKLHDIFEDCQGRIVVALFSSNIGRIQQIVKAARAEGRKIVFCGRSMNASVSIAKKLGLLEVPPEMEITTGQIKDTPDREVVIVTTGSQGEPMSVLHRIAMKMHKQIKVKDGDTVILSSKFIPGNERAITHIINRLYKGGARVIYEKVSDIHVSGHAFQEELKLMINLTKPTYFIPIHGEFRHLIRHTHLAREVGIPDSHILLAQNGQVITFDDTGGHIDGSVPSGRILVDGKGVGDVERSILKERRFLSEEGLVIVSAVIDKKTGKLIEGPCVESHGFVVDSHKSKTLEAAKDMAREIMEIEETQGPSRKQVLQDKVKKALQKYLYSVIERRPVVFPIILEV